MPHPDDANRVFCPDHQRVWDAIARTNDSVSKLYATTAVQANQIERIEREIGEGARQGFTLRMAIFVAVLSVCSSCAAALILAVILKR